MSVRDPLVPENKINNSPIVNDIAIGINVPDAEAYHYLPIHTYLSADQGKVFIHFPNAHTVTSTQNISDAFTAAKKDVAVGVWGGETVLSLPIAEYEKQFGSEAISAADAVDGIPIERQLTIRSGTQAGYQCKDARSLAVAEIFTRIGVGVNLTERTIEDKGVHANTRHIVFISEGTPNLKVGLEFYSYPIGFKTLCANGKTAEVALDMLGNKFEQTAQTGSVLFVYRTPVLKGGTVDWDMWKIDPETRKPIRTGTVNVVDHRITGITL